ncbi:MAG: hypothetical protein ABJA67_10040 [Chthonomonadales bacterium]
MANHITLNAWFEIIEQEYLADYVKSGGSAVRFVSGNDATLERLADDLGDISDSQGFHYAQIDPSIPKVDGRRPTYHNIDEFFFSVTESVPWNEWAANEAREFLRINGIDIASGCSLNDVESIANYNGRDTGDLINQYQREFITPRIRDTRLTVEFRSAMVALGKSQLLPDSVTPTTEQVLLEWLNGKSVKGGAAALKKIQIFGKIDKSSGRHALSSFCRWVSLINRSGVVVTLDLRPYQRKRETEAQRLRRINELAQVALGSENSPEEARRILSTSVELNSIYYSQLAYVEMLQLLRRFIDEIESFHGLLLIVLTTPDFYDQHSPRNFFNYDALQTRIGQEVHDVDRANPSAALVHLQAEE